MAEEWYYAKHGTQFGPVTRAQLAELSDQGTVGPTDLVWNKRMAQWAAAGSVQGLFANAFTPPLPPPLPMPPPPPLPPPLPLATGISAADATGPAQALLPPPAAVRSPVPQAPLSRTPHIVTQAKWTLLGWSAVCALGFAWGQFGAAAKETPALYPGNLNLPLWCILWLVVGLPALVVWLLKK